MSPETRKLLLAERNADREYGNNLVPPVRGVQTELNDGSRLNSLAFGPHAGIVSSSACIDQRDPVRVFG